MRTILFTQFLLCIFLWTTGLCAQEQYRILFINSDSINIGGKQCYVNDCFSSEDRIRWKNKNQVMKVICLSTQQQRIFAARDLKKSKHKTLSSYISQRKSMSTRDGGVLTLSQLEDHLAATFYLIDSIEIKTIAPIDEHHFFYAEYCYKGNSILKRLPAIEQGFLIDFSLFTIDDKPITPFETDLSIFYLDEAKSSSTPITSKMHVVPVKAIF